MTDAYLVGFPRYANWQNFNKPFEVIYSPEWAKSISPTYGAGICKSHSKSSRGSGYFGVWYDEYSHSYAKCFL